MVRRLVEHEEVRAARDDEREREPAPLAARERASPASRAPPSRRRGSGRAASARRAAAGRSRPSSRRAPSRARRARPRAGRSTRARRRGRAAPGPPPGSRRPRIVSSSVVLPAPFGPTSATCSPRSSANDDAVQQLLVAGAQVERLDVDHDPARSASASGTRTRACAARPGPTSTCCALIRSICFCFDFACFAFVFFAPKRSTKRSRRAISSACRSAVFAACSARAACSRRQTCHLPGKKTERPRSSSSTAVVTASRNQRSCATRITAASIVAQQLLEPLDRLDVEVVRRLVEQQQVGLRGERAGERGARQLAARERRRAAGRGRRR